MAKTMRVKLIGLSGEDSSEFSDLLGTEGVLEDLLSKVRYLPDGRTDWLTFLVQGYAHVSDNQTYTSRLGNTFKFKILPEAEACSKN